MKWVELIPAKRGWQVHSEFVARTLPRRVQERIQAEAEAESAAFQAKFPELFRVQPP